jgi:dienelactone hydrolase
MSPRRRGPLGRGTRVAVLGLMAFGVIVVLIPMGMGWLTLWAVTHPRCASGPDPSRRGLAAEAVIIPAMAGGDRQGYFFRGENGAVIVVPPALGSNRSGLLHEVTVLVENGFSVLSFDSRSCAGRGAHSLGPWEAEDIVAAVAYLGLRADVDSTRIGVHGFSQAGASALFAAVDEPAIRTVVAEGGYVDYGAQTLGLDSPQGWFMSLFNMGARLGYRVATGTSIDRLRLWDALQQIAPRPVLLVYGEHELTLAGARQAAALGGHITLWEVPDAAHGTYLETAGRDEFERHVVSFFTAALSTTP